MDKQKRITRQARFLRDPQPIRLGNIAANLSRISSHLDDPRLKNAVLTFIDESKWFCEWAAIEAVHTNDIETAYMLATIQRQLVRWEHHLDDIYRDGGRRAEMAETARAWSNHLLVLSGLLERAA